jgi:hypothetical protein
MNWKILGAIQSTTHDPRKVGLLKASPKKGKPSSAWAAGAHPPRPPPKGGWRCDRCWPSPRTQATARQRSALLFLTTNAKEQDGTRTGSSTAKCKSAQPLAIPAATLDGFRPPWSQRPRRGGFGTGRRRRRGPASPSRGCCRPGSCSNSSSNNSRARRTAGTTRCRAPRRIGPPAGALTCADSYGDCDAALK